MQDLIAKAATLLEALPYIQKFSGETFVVKYGGSFMDSPDAEVRNGVARDIVFLEAVEINPEVVAAINAMGGEALLFAGPDIFKCRKLWLDYKENPGRKIDIGFVGE